MHLLAASLRLLFLLHQLNQRSVAVGLRALAEENLLDHTWLWRPDRMLQRQIQEVTSLETQQCVSVCVHRLKGKNHQCLTSIFMAIMTISGSPTVTLSPAFTSTWTQEKQLVHGGFITNQYNKTKPIMSLRNKKKKRSNTHSIMTSSFMPPPQSHCSGC